MTYQVIDRQEISPRPGELYYHFKHPDTLYSIVAVAKDTSNDDTPMVVYRNEITMGYFIRHLEEFMDILKLEDGTITNRFTRYAEAR